MDPQILNPKASNFLKPEALNPKPNPKTPNPQSSHAPYTRSRYIEPMASCSIATSSPVAEAELSFPTASTFHLQLSHVALSWVLSPYRHSL